LRSTPRVENRSFGSKEEEKKYSLVVIWGEQGFFWEGGVLYTVLDPLVREEEEKKYSLVVIWGGQGFFWEGGVLYTALDLLVRKRRRRRSTV